MPPPIPDNAELLITSQNGLHSLLTLTDRRDWNVWAVGDVTAQLARNFGFKSVVSASGTGQDLLETVLGNKESEGPYIHLSGRDIRFDVAGALRAAGYTARRDIYYENNTVSDLSGVDLSPLTHIALYSPLAAQALVQSGVEAGHLTAVSISEAVDECLSGVKLKTRYVAKRPEESAMIAALCA